MSKAYDNYLKTDYWKSVTHAVKKRADYRCQLCNSQHDLCAHHRDYSHRGNELNYLNDLVCLCRRCHEIFHGKVEVESPHHEPKVKPSRFDRKAGRSGRGEIDSAQVEKDMPPGDGPIELTNELIQRCRTNRGAFTNAAIIPLGATQPLISGWADRLIGKKVSRAEYRQALEGRYLYGMKPPIL